MTSPAPGRGRISLVVHTAALAALVAGAMQAQAQQPAAGTPPPAAAPASNAPNAAADKKPPKSGAAKTAPTEKSVGSYSLGVLMGEQLRGGGISAEFLSTERFTQGVRDALSGKAKVTDEDRENISKLAHSAQQAMVDTNHSAAAKFLAANARKPDVVTTASGLQYKVLAAGSGDSPKATDEVEVNYRGTLLDGMEFDSSYKRGQPASFQVNRVIPGWTEALELMKPGAKYQLFIPPQLAYDQRSRPPIPPGSMLIFEVELLSIKAPAPPAAAAGAAAAPPPAAPQPGTPPKK